MENTPGIFQRIWNLSLHRCETAGREMVIVAGVSGDAEQEVIGWISVELTAWGWTVC